MSKSTKQAPPYAVTVLSSESARYESIGRMLAEFARAEAMLHLVVNHLTGLGPDLGGAILGGARLPDLMAAARATMKVRSTAEGKAEDIDSCMKQLDVISKERAKIAHRFVIMADDGVSIETSNVFTAKSHAARDDRTFSPAEMLAMTEDCHCITFRLSRYSGVATSQTLDVLVPHIYAPWRYTPPSPYGSPKQRRADRR